MKLHGQRPEVVVVAARPVPPEDVHARLVHREARLAALLRLPEAAHGRELHPLVELEVVLPRVGQRLAHGGAAVHVHGPRRRAGGHGEARRGGHHRGEVGPRARRHVVRPRLGRRLAALGALHEPAEHEHLALVRRGGVREARCGRGARPRRQRRPGVERQVVGPRVVEAGRPRAPAERHQLVLHQHQREALAGGEAGGPPGGHRAPPARGEVVAPHHAVVLGRAEAAREHQLAVVVHGGGGVARGGGLALGVHRGPLHRGEHHRLLRREGHLRRGGVGGDVDGVPHGDAGEGLHVLRAEGAPVEEDAREGERAARLDVLAVDVVLGGDAVAHQLQRAPAAHAGHGGGLPGVERRQRRLAAVREDAHARGGGQHLLLVGELQAVVEVGRHEVARGGRVRVVEEALQHVRLHGRHRLHQRPAGVGRRVHAQRLAARHRVRHLHVGERRLLAHGELAVGRQAPPALEGARALKVLERGEDLLAVHRGGGGARVAVVHVHLEGALRLRGDPEARLLRVAAGELVQEVADGLLGGVGVGPEEQHVRAVGAHLAGGDERPGVHHHLHLVLALQVGGGHLHPVGPGGGLLLRPEGVLPDVHHGGLVRAPPVEDVQVVVVHRGQRAVARLGLLPGHQVLAPGRGRRLEGVRAPRHRLHPVAHALVVPDVDVVLARRGRGEHHRVGSVQVVARRQLLRHDVRPGQRLPGHARHHHLERVPGGGARAREAVLGHDREGGLQPGHHPRGQVPQGGLRRRRHLRGDGRHREGRPCGRLAVHRDGHLAGAAPHGVVGHQRGGRVHGGELVDHRQRAERLHVVRGAHGGAVGLRLGGGHHQARLDGDGGGVPHHVVVAAAVLQLHLQARGHPRARQLQAVAAQLAQRKVQLVHPRVGGVDGGPRRGGEPRAELRLEHVGGVVERRVARLVVQGEVERHGVPVRRAHHPRRHRRLRLGAPGHAHLVHQAGEPQPDLHLLGVLAERLGLLVRRVRRRRPVHVQRQAHAVVRRREVGPRVRLHGRGGGEVAVLVRPDVHARGEAEVVVQAEPVAVAGGGGLLGEDAPAAVGRRRGHPRLERELHAGEVEGLVRLDLEALRAGEGEGAAAGHLDEPGGAGVVRPEGLPARLGAGVRLAERADVLAVQEHVELHLAGDGGHVGDGVGAVLVVVRLARDLVPPGHEDVEVVPARGAAAAVLVHRLQREGGAHAVHRRLQVVVRAQIRRVVRVAHRRHRRARLQVRLEGGALGHERVVGAREDGGVVATGGGGEGHVCGLHAHAVEAAHGAGVRPGVGAVAVRHDVRLENLLVRVEGSRHHHLHGEVLKLAKARALVARLVGEGGELLDVPGDDAHAVYLAGGEVGVVAALRVAVIRRHPVGLHGAGELHLDGGGGAGEVNRAGAVVQREGGVQPVLRGVGAALVERQVLRLGERAAPQPHLADQSLEAALEGAEADVQGLGALVQQERVRAQHVDVAIRARVHPADDPVEAVDGLEPRPAGPVHADVRLVLVVGDGDELPLARLDGLVGGLGGLPVGAVRHVEEHVAVLNPDVHAVVTGGERRGAHGGLVEQRLLPGHRARVDVNLDGEARVRAPGGRVKLHRAVRRVGDRERRIHAIQLHRKLLVGVHGHDVVGGERAAEHPHVVHAAGEVGAEDAHVEGPHRLRRGGGGAVQPRGVEVRLLLRLDHAHKLPRVPHDLRARFAVQVQHALRVQLDEVGDVGALAVALVVEGARRGVREDPRAQRPGGLGADQHRGLHALPAYKLQRLAGVQLAVLPEEGPAVAVVLGDGGRHGGVGAVRRVQQVAVELVEHCQVRRPVLPEDVHVREQEGAAVARGERQPAVADVHGGVEGGLAQEDRLRGHLHHQRVHVHVGEGGGLFVHQHLQEVGVGEVHARHRQLRPLQRPVQARRGVQRVLEHLRLRLRGQGDGVVRHDGGRDEVGVVNCSLKGTDKVGHGQNLVVRVSASHEIIEGCIVDDAIGLSLSNRA
mmetsp:Transcript_15048/g.32311  ORF Transcript_15048/g.32311 Transcript_15048/m.32311 type:complete len:1969 (+) Transcript_15048:266-6172(+)